MDSSCELSRSIVGGVACNNVLPGGVFARWRPILTGGKSASLWDVAGPGKIMQIFEASKGKIEGISFSPDGTRVATGDEIGNPVVEFDNHCPNCSSPVIGAGDREWIAFTPEGSFDASKSGAGLISVLRGNEKISLEKVWAVLHWPELVREKLVGGPGGKVKAAAAAIL